MILAINFDKVINETKKLKINRYIKDVLLSREKLQLAGLGTIKIVRMDAGVRGGKFSPPESDLDFSNEESVEEEGWLANAIAEDENISLEEAKQQVLEFIDDIKFAFSKEEEFKISGVCSLFLDEDSNIDVRKDPDFIIDPDSFGLESFELEHKDKFLKEDEPEKEPAKEEPKSEKLVLKLDVDYDMHKFEETYVTPGRERKTEESGQKKEEEITSPGDSYEAPESPPPPTPTYIPEDHFNNRKKNRNTVWIILGAIVVILVAFILIPLKTSFMDNGINFSDIFGDSDEVRQEEGLPGVKDEDFNFDEMVDDMEQDLEEETSMGKALAPGEESPELTQEESPQTVTEEYIEYHIIAGSFRDYENAQELQQKLTLEGYPSLVIETETGIYRVSAASFRDKVTALNRLVEFRENTGMSSAWLMNLD